MGAARASSESMRPPTSQQFNHSGGRPSAAEAGPPPRTPSGFARQGPGTPGGMRRVQTPGQARGAEREEEEEEVMFGVNSVGGVAPGFFKENQVRTPTAKAPTGFNSFVERELATRTTGMWPLLPPRYYEHTRYVPCHTPAAA
jgi:hypothetical protein